MTLILTAIAAAVAAGVYLSDTSLARRRHLGFLVLAYLGATLMWCVDGIACVMEGEPFVELSDSAAMIDDALLGVCVIALGLVAWAVVRVVCNARERAVAA